jgi:hypothetical protein
MQKSCTLHTYGQQDDAVVLNSVSLCQSLPDNAVYSFSVSTVPVLYNNNVKWRMKIFRFITCITKLKPYMEKALIRLIVLYMKFVEKSAVDHSTVMVGLSLTRRSQKH